MESVNESQTGLEAELAELRARVQALEDDRAIWSLLVSLRAHGG